MKLKPCPFCGEVPELAEEETATAFYHTRVLSAEWGIGCKTEGCFVGDYAPFWFDTKEEAIEAWNKRA